MSDLHFFLKLFEHIEPIFVMHTTRFICARKQKYCKT